MKAKEEAGYFISDDDPKILNWLAKARREDKLYRMAKAQITPCGSSNALLRELSELGTIKVMAFASKRHREME